jgi:alkaline phosphatase
VRVILESSGKVLAVFQGHHHNGGHHDIGDIHYYTLKAMVEGSGAENSSYATVDAFDHGLIRITGYRRSVGIDLTTRVTGV